LALAKGELSADMANQIVLLEINLHRVIEDCEDELSKLNDLDSLIYAD
jgi:hypothetical protein